MSTTIYPNKRVEYSLLPTLLQARETEIPEEKLEQIRRNREEYESIQKELKDLYFYPDTGC